jgi:peptide deformylase
MIRDIPQLGDPVLRAPNRPVTEFELESSTIQELIDDLIDTMRHAGGAGIAANQVGVNLRICILEVNDNPRYPYKPAIPLTVLVNPQIQPIDGVMYLNNEGCLSVPIRGDVHRYMGVRLSARDRHWEPVEAEYRGLSAGTLQHEVDHLDAKLIVDRMHDPLSMSTWENFQHHHAEAYLRRIRPVIDATEVKS